MKTIAIQIDAGEEYCDACEHAFMDSDGWKCYLWLDDDILAYRMKSRMRRRLECRDAEQKAKGQDHETV